MRRSVSRAVPLAALILGMSGLAVPAAQASEAPTTARPADGDLDVLFVGAHPDDEAGTLSTIGQWVDSGLHAGVLTITRGEGGGNAVGTEEGPALGLLREAEERRAVGKAGVADVHDFDLVDFYYTVSAPLTDEAWGHEAALAKAVRLLRETRPEVVVTMEPAPLPGQHGHHQMAGRLAVEAYEKAADPKAFPGQITGEGLKPWRAKRLFLHRADLKSQVTGPDCVKPQPTDPSADVYGVWSGAKAPSGKTWAQVEREAQREYVSQGWGGFPDVPADPAKLGCDYLTQVDSRVPYTRDATGVGAPLEGAIRAADGAPPLGTEFFLTTDSFEATPGGSFTVTAHARAPRDRDLPRARVELQVPAGWTVTGDGRLGTVGDRERTAAFTVTPPAGADPGRVRLGGTLSTAVGSGATGEAVEVRPAVTGAQEPIPRVADFDAWAEGAGQPQLTGRVKRVLTLGSGGEREVTMDLDNASDAARSGSVRLDLPDGFAAEPATAPYGPIAPGGTGEVTFAVRNTDASLPTGNAGGDAGDYDYTITTTSSEGGTHTAAAALELVPVAEFPQAGAAPTVDGAAGEGEYTGPEIDLSRLWEGEACASAADCSATGRVTWHGSDLYLLVDVKDDTMGTVLPREDCKRHWRTDSVEIAVDPRGDSENTSTTFKTGIFPATAEGGPCFQRDADNHQGPGEETAPGMTVASKVTEGTGYTVETKIPGSVLPTAIDPDRLGLNVFVYDSDTRDKTGQTRIGWSTWGGVQGDPYRWGLVRLPGYTPPPGAPTEPPAPVMPSTAARSVDSPQSILQAARTGVPLAAGPAAPRAATGRISGRPTVSDGSVTFTLASTGAGTAHVYVWDPQQGTLGSAKEEITTAGRHRLTVEASPEPDSVLLVAFESAESGTESSAAALR
ncbi:MAG: hypothetical protein GEV11_12645 [Streptosporangiales bacterium]|nr:hypothetical protein [Streptosporangiales bacterium]